MVRHLAAGLLGPNAPEPFRKNALDQELVWDGRDDTGKPAGGGPFRFRVRLGSQARLEKYLGGLKTMSALPMALFVIDPHQETIAVSEARRLSRPQVPFQPEHVAGAHPAQGDAQELAHLGGQRLAPHVAPIKDRKVKGLDGRTTRTLGYQTSQKLRKRIEEIFGWCKEVGGLRRTRSADPSTSSSRATRSSRSSRPCAAPWRPARARCCPPR